MSAMPKESSCNVENIMDFLLNFCLNCLHAIIHIVLRISSEISYDLSQLMGISPAYILSDHCSYILYPSLSLSSELHLYSSLKHDNKYQA